MESMKSILPKKIDHDPRPLSSPPPGKRGSTILSFPSYKAPPRLPNFDGMKIPHLTVMQPRMGVNSALVVVDADLDRDSATARMASLVKISKLRY
jgi:hypothetical protein